MHSPKSYCTAALTVVALASMLSTSAAFAGEQSTLTSGDAFVRALSRMDAAQSHNGMPGNEQPDQAAQPKVQTDSTGPSAFPNAAAVQRIYKSATQDSDPASMARLGVLYQQGVGVQQSYAEAIKWYTRAAEAGDADAMNNLGSLYVAGAGLHQDFAEAMKWYRHAVDAGSVMAITNIAKLYYFGLGVQRSYPEAAKQFQLATIRGSASAMNSLGLMYDTGLGVEQNQSAAATLIKEAARLGYGPAMANLGSMYDEGKGVETDHMQAYAWIRAALKVGVPTDARDAIVYRLGAMSARLTPDELAQAEKLADQISGSSRASLPEGPGIPTTHLNDLPAQ